jgi:hypothetical protein
MSTKVPAVDRCDLSPTIPSRWSAPDLIAATGWLAHTIQAALTGLRQKCYTLVKSKVAHGKTAYRVPGGS